MSNNRLLPRDIDDANLTYWYSITETQRGSYYSLKYQNAAMPSGFYASERSVRPAQVLISLTKTFQGTSCYNYSPNTRPDH